MHGANIILLWMMEIHHALVFPNFVLVANLTNFHQMTTEKFRPQQLHIPE